MKIKTFCKNHGETVNAMRGLIRCKRDGSVRQVGKGCSVKCPHFKLTLSWGLVRWWERL